MPVPYDDPNGFIEAGHRFKAWQPASETARHVLVIQAWKDGDEDGEPTREAQVPMFHPNVFGLDVEDMAAPEDATEHLVEEFSQ
jgi:hypothetical protein